MELELEDSKKIAKRQHLQEVQDLKQEYRD